MIEDRTRRLLDVRLARDQAGQRLPSVTACVARDGEVVWTGGRGRVDGQVPDASTQYRAGSIAKTFVATVVLMLRDAGRLSLSDPIGEYLDADAAGWARSMTISGPREPRWPSSRRPRSGPTRPGAGQVGGTITQTSGTRCLAP